jgi:hypothetical protein
MDVRYMRYYRVTNSDGVVSHPVRAQNAFYAVCKVLGFRASDKSQDNKALQHRLVRCGKGEYVKYPSGAKFSVSISEESYDYNISRRLNKQLRAIRSTRVAV